MLRYLTRRVLASIPVLVVASLITFWLVRVSVDPLAKYRNLRNSATIIPIQRKALGLDEPIIVQWWKWLTKFVTGDMGVSSRTQGSGVEDDRSGGVADAPAAVLGHALLDRACTDPRCLLRGEAVLGRGLHDHRAVVPRHSRCPTSGSRCWPSVCS